MIWDDILVWPKNILTIEVSTATPMLIGWYTPDKIDPTGLRSSELKGLWRWWARAFIAGVLFDNNYITGRIGNDILLKPSFSEVSIISHALNYLGLGYSFGGKSSASKYILRIWPTDNLRVQKFMKKSNSRQRIKLLTLNRDIEYISENTRFKINVYVRHNLNEEIMSTAIKILIIALQLSGLGKGSRRALGSLDIVSINGELSISNVLRKLIIEVYEGISKLILENKELYDNLKRLKTKADHKIHHIPPLPVISKEFIHMDGMDIPITLISWFKTRNWIDIHNFFIRSNRCRKLTGRSICNDLLRKEHSAWILGLPRGRPRTGYSIKVKDVTRRASPIFVTYHSRFNKFGSNTVFISIFLSGDWPKVIEWRGRGKKKINVDANVLLNAYRALYIEFDEYIKKTIGLSLLRPQNRIWP